MMPFKKASQVQLFSFRLTDKSNVCDTIFLTLGNFDTDDSSLISQRVNLRLPEIDTLTDIVFNECNRFSFLEINKGACYSPHNGVLFLDKTGRPFAFWEICFHCSQFKVGNAPKLDDLCEPAWVRLRNFFVDLGLNVEAKASGQEDRR